MDYTSLLQLLSTLSWNISSDSVDKIPMCSDTNQTFTSDTKRFFIYHDGFSQESLKQHNCSCHILTNGNHIKINIQQLTLINKNKTSLVLYGDEGTKKIFKDNHIFKWSSKLSNGRIRFTEDNGISQFLFKVSKGDTKVQVLCNQNSTEITHPGIVNREEENSSISNNDSTSSINIGMILIGIGIFMIFISIIIGFICLRKSRQAKEVPEKVINTHKVSEIIPEKTAEIKCAKGTKVSESTPCAEDYEFCEIPEYYTISKETPEVTVPNLPSKPPPIKQESVDITTSSDTGDRNSNTQIDQTSTTQTERYSNFEIESKPNKDLQRETRNETTVDSNQSEIYSNYLVDGQSESQSRELKTGEYDKNNLDDDEDTYNHLENVLSPKTSLNKSFTEESLNKGPNINKISGDVEIMMLDNCDNSDGADQKKQTLKDQAEQNNANEDNVEIRATGSYTSRSHSDTKLLDNSVNSQFDNVVGELVQRSKSCTPTIDNQYPEMIIIENDLYQSIDG